MHDWYQSSTSTVNAHDGAEWRGRVSLAAAITTPAAVAAVAERSACSGRAATDAPPLRRQPLRVRGDARPRRRDGARLGAELRKDPPEVVGIDLAAIHREGGDQSLTRRRSCGHLSAPPSSVVVSPETRRRSARAQG